MFCYCATQILRYTYDGCTGVSGKLIVDILHNSQRHHLAKYKFSMISLTEPFLFCGWSNYLEWTPNRSKAPPKWCLFSIPPPSQDCSFPLGMGRERLWVGILKGRYIILIDWLKLCLFCFQSSFRQIDGTSPTRESLLNVLAKLDAILIRATYHTSMQRSVLRDVSLDTAVPYNTGQEIASLVEDCSCPAGYTGLSCEVSLIVYIYIYIYIRFIW